MVIRVISNLANSWGTSRGTLRVAPEGKLGCG